MFKEQFWDQYTERVFIMLLGYEVDQSWRIIVEEALYIICLYSITFLKCFFFPSVFQKSHYLLFLKLLVVNQIDVDLKYLNFTTYWFHFKLISRYQHQRKSECKILCYPQFSDICLPPIECPLFIFDKVLFGLQKLYINFLSFLWFFFIFIIL